MRLVPNLEHECNIAQMVVGIEFNLTSQVSGIARQIFEKAEDAVFLSISRAPHSTKLRPRGKSTPRPPRLTAQISSANLNQYGERRFISPHRPAAAGPRRASDNNARQRHNSTSGRVSRATHPRTNTRLQALLSILDHSMRGQTEQQRLIGTLLGTRSEDGSEVEIRSAYAVPHTENEEQVEVDFLYQKQMLALHLRANPREQLVGWYATAAELNTFSALIQNFYAGSQAGEGTWPHPAVHLTVSTVPGQDVRTRTYISVPVGVTEQRSLDSCSFIPVPHQLKYGEAERSGLELMASAREDESRKVLVSTDLDTLEKSIESVLDMLDRVSNYVSNVLDEEAQPSSALGQYLMNALSLAPKVDPANIERDLYVVCLSDKFMLKAVATTTSRTF
jgi:hypothetical protein